MLLDSRPCRSGLLALAVLCAAPAAARAQSEATSLPSVTLPPDLERVLRDYENAWRARDADALATLFHEDGFVLSVGQPPVHGRTAIRARYAASGGELHLRALAWAASDTVGYIIGAFGARPDRDSGKFVLALRRASVRQPWLIAADMDNPDARPARRP